MIRTIADRNMQERIQRTQTKTFDPGCEGNHMSENKLLHRAIRQLAGWAIWSFFSEVHLIGEENVPKEGPMIVCVAYNHER